MRTYIYDKEGNETELPRLISWDFSMGSGEPCDAFEICFAFENKLMKTLYNACRFRATYGGKTVFYGCIDEYEVDIDGTSACVSMSGRSMAALLLDNEAEAAEYTVLSAELLISRHVTPYGISASIGIGLKNLSGFSVSQGESEWSVIKRFCSLCGSAQPMFSSEGVLLLGTQSQKRHTVNDNNALTSMRLGDKRYGMISAVLVKNRSTGAKYGVKNQPFIDRGGCSRRVIGVPRKTGAEAMRYTAAYQIKQSAKNKFTISLGFEEQFPMQVGDKVDFDSPRLGLKGVFTVMSVRSFANGSTVGSEIKMEVPV